MAKVNPLAVQSNVSTPCSAHRDMMRHWDLIRDLRGGTLAMRDATTKWLPREPKENLGSYQNRLARSILYEGYTDAVQRIVAKPFAKPVVFRNAERIDPRLQEIEKDADQKGNGIGQFAAKQFRNGIDYGVAYFLVDYPRLRGNESVAEERAIGARPRFIEVKPENLIGWKYERDSAGVNRLAEIRVLETQTEYAIDNPYSEQTATYVRVYRPNEWILYRQRAGREIGWTVVEDGPMSIGKIPLVSVYFNRTDDMEATPALEGVAWLNLAHWQSSSDHRNYLRFARVGFIIGSGFSEEEQKKFESFGPGSVLWSSQPDAKMGVVEHAGHAAAIGRTDLIDLEERMRLLGLQPFFTQTSGNQTATGKAIDEGRATTEIQGWIRNLEAGLEQGYGFAADWIGQKLPENFSVDIFNEFSISMRAADDLEKLIKMRVAKEISQRTFLEEVKRRNLLSELLDVDAEIDAIESEMSSIAGPPIELDSDDDDDSKDRPPVNDAAGSED